MTRIALIGAGKIGEALVAGLLDAGTKPKDIVICEASEGRAREVATRYSILATSLDVACDGADIIVLAVKPNAIADVANSVAKSISESVHEAVVVSLAAGVPTETIETRLSAGSPVVRVMPNTAMLVGEGTSAVATGRYVDPEELALVVEMMGAVGRVVQVPESQIDIATALSGSGPAYYFLFVEAMIDAGVEQGLSREVSTELVSGAVHGAAAMISADVGGPADLRYAVTSPGGTTAAALRSLESAGLRSAVSGAVQACVSRATAMSEASSLRSVDER